MLLGQCCLYLCQVKVCFAAENQDERLKALYESHKWFDLRAAIGERSGSEFYRSVVACAFNDLPRCEYGLRDLINKQPESNEAVEAHRTLASTYLTHGRYRKALEQVNALLAVRPEDADAKNGRALIAILAESTDQDVSSRKFTRLRLEGGGIPISIHGVRASYWFDTGANLSIMSESEAARFGLKARAVSTQVGVSTGSRISLRVAVADELSIGSIRLRNVAFLVGPDDQPPFNEWKPGKRGLIGMPVLMALRRFTWDRDGSFEVGSKPNNLSHASLCFDGSYPVAQIQFDTRNIALVLDTGAVNTDLFPPFAVAFPEVMRRAKKESYKTEGVGSAVEMSAAVLDSLQFRIGGLPVVLSTANVLLNPTDDRSKFFEGNLGIDLLRQAQKTTFDFGAMTLTLHR